jgi:hypothetical protein
MGANLVAPGRRPPRAPVSRRTRRPVLYAEGRVGRRELPVDPDSGPLAQFACDLRALRRSAGSPAYRALAREAHYSATSLSQAAAGNSLPSLEVTLAYVAACGGDAQRWRQRWEELAALLAAEAGPVVAAGPRDGQAASGWRRPHRWRGMFAAAGLSVLGAAGAAAVILAAPGSAHGPAGRRSAPSLPKPLALGYAATIAADCPYVRDARTLAHAPVPPAWSTGTLGGWTGGGCYGEFFFERQPGRSVLSPNYVEWTVRGIPAAPHGCGVSVHIANSPHSAGAAHYYFSTLVNGTPRVIGDRVINQGEHHGDWVATGFYHVRDGWLRVVVHAQDPRRRDITAGAINVDCPAH